MRGNESDIGVTRRGASIRIRQIGRLGLPWGGEVGFRQAQRRSIVDSRRVNSFTNAEEAEVGLTQVVPFQLESRLRELDGSVQGVGNWQVFAVREAYSALQSGHYFGKIVVRVNGQA